MIFMSFASTSSVGIIFSRFLSKLTLIIFKFLLIIHKIFVFPKICFFILVDWFIFYWWWLIYFIRFLLILKDLRPQRRFLRKSPFSLILHIQSVNSWESRRLVLDFRMKTINTNGFKYSIERKQNNVIIKIYRSQMKFFPYLIDLFLWKSKTLFKCLIISIMIPKNIFMISFIIFNPNAIEFPLFKNSILNCPIAMICTS